MTSGERRLNQREAEAWRAIGWLFEHGEAEWGICLELRGIRDEALRRRMNTRLWAWFEPAAGAGGALLWWPVNRKHHTTAERREGLHCRALCCGFLAALAASGESLFSEE